nr:putative reverse transcriptase domain, reverse transcriptase zinc-binding domain protein [Tanacetum cinerariifolium]
GRSAYARVLIEIATDVELVISLIIAIPMGNKEGHTFATIDIDQEVKSAMFSMGNDKSPGPDGFTAAFFKDTWYIIGVDVIKAVKEFFTNGRLLKELNHTIIALIPKVNTPARVTDYRPISCCNVLFKCISKIIANRLKGSLKRLVSPNQSAFVSGRCISDYILLIQEIMHNYHLDRGVPRCAFKVDIQKAYATVDWYFLRVILIGFGFHERMIAWIMECVTTTSFSISINGLLHGYFEGKRGLCQGDPLSPYLFTLIMEVFTLMLKRRVNETSTFTYHRFCSELDLINLCFADDMFLFAHGDVNSAKVIKDALDDFNDASGLNPSMPKSKAYFCNVINYTKLAILNILPFEEDRLPVKYLGVPLVSSWLISRDYNTSRGKVKVAWDVVCLPKQEGGLGIRRLNHFNKALMVSYVWKLLSLKESLWVKDGMGKPFSVHNVWDSIRPMDNQVPWCDLVWFHACILRHAFNMWLIFKHRLRTQDCLRSWEVNSDLAIAGLTSVGPSLTSIITHRLPIAKRKSSKSCIGKLVVAVAAYFIWHERNYRVFNKVKQSVTEVVDCILSNIRLKLLSCRFKKSRDAIMFARLWEIPISNLK